jgi:low affinity Fe/Cu permease
MVKSDLFPRFARATARTVGHTSAFATALVIILVWGVTGPLFHFSDTWQLVINTGTTVVTFLMVFVIQQTQNRDSEAMHVKLDEIIRALRGAQNELLDIEDLTEEELDTLRAQYFVMARAARLQPHKLLTQKTRRMRQDAKSASTAASPSTKPAAEPINETGRER